MRVDDLILVKQMRDKLVQLMIKLMMHLMMQLMVVKIKLMMKLIMICTYLCYSSVILQNGQITVCRRTDDMRGVG